MPPLTIIDVEPNNVLLFPRHHSSAASLSASLRLVNSSDGQVAFKVKATNTTDYSIKPSAGSIRKGDSKEVIISRKHDEATKPFPERSKDRFLIQGAAVVTEEQKLLLHAADRGKQAGKQKFWEGIEKAVMQEKQLDVGWLPEDAQAESAPAGQEQPPHNGNGDKGKASGKGSEDIDAILGKLSKPGAKIGKPSATGGPMPQGAGGSDDPEEPGPGSPPPEEAAATAPAPAAQRVPVQLAERTKVKEDMVLRGHSRPVTFVGFDPTGAYLFTCGKDKLVIAWSVSDGQNARQYEGHEGAVWACSVSGDSRLLLSCGADALVILWEVATAAMVTQVRLPGVVRAVEWAPGLAGQRFVTSSNKFKDKPAAISLWALGLQQGPETPCKMFSIEEPILPSTATQVAWAGPTADKLCSVHDNGEVHFWDAATGALISRLQAHKGPCSMIYFPMDRRLMASCGRQDMQVKLWDLSETAGDAEEPAGCEEGGEQPPPKSSGSGTFRARLLQTYTSDRPLNAVAVRPGLRYEQATLRNPGIAVDCAVGGGQDARDVALVGSTSDAQFEPQLLKLGDPTSSFGDDAVDMLPGEADVEGAKGRRGGHFGPIHTLAFSLDAALIASGSEDGNVRVREVQVG
mmetsp:Transcript_61500/g.146696  ORF Transcript_61500/g.146696 Transcript_61500/m.146696 type:complete len:630 (-) Transcript_61500:161-2050(-)